MNRDPVFTTYAEALLELADERGELDAVVEEVGFLRSLLVDDLAFRTFLETPSIDASEKSAVLDRALRDRLSSSLVDFVQVVVRKNRQLFLGEILEEFGHLHDEKLGRIHVDAVSAVALGDESREELTRLLGEKLRKTIVLDTSIQPQILGGLVLRIGDVVVDGSSRRRLKEVSARWAANRLGSEFVHED